MLVRRHFSFCIIKGVKGYMYIPILELKLRSFLGKLSNNNYEDIHKIPEDQVEKYIQEATKEFDSYIRKQLFRTKEDFRIRSSNVGRPSCQLQAEAAGVEKNPMPYNHIMRMMLGDLSEVLLNLMLKLSGTNITGAKTKVKWKLAADLPEVEGENDIEIDGKVYDIKSASPWAYEHKWLKGCSSIAEEDNFGYIGQLLSYSVSQGKPPGGWVVLNKSSGEVTVVEFNMTKEEVKEFIKKCRTNTRIITENQPFTKCFEDFEETFHGKKTGNRRLSTICGFCQFIRHCWPRAELRTQVQSKAKNPKSYWYSHYENTENLQEP